jgi:histidyl-tRNA synthetase
LQELLDLAGIAYRVNPRLVRGLDYYTRTVFEWVTTQLGAQGAVCSGGRYDGLVEHLGGKAVPAIGWAIGLERLVELCKLGEVASSDLMLDAYLVAVGDEAACRGLILAEELRNQSPALRIEVNSGGGSFKSQFKRADKSGARVALILGEAELANGVIGIKPLRKDAEQQDVPWDKAADTINSMK